MTLMWPFLFVALSSRPYCSIAQGDEQCVDCAGTSRDKDALAYLKSIKNISIPSEAIRQDKQTTFYTVVLTLPGDKSVVQASRRYSEFHKLKKELTLIPSDGKFPKKQISDWACTLVKSLRSCVDDRRLGLEAYLNRALHHLSQTSDEERYLQARILTTFMLKTPDDVPVAYDGPGPLSKGDLIKEYYDANMGVAFTMVTKMSWEWGGSWGLSSHPESSDGKHRHISIMTHKEDMAPFEGNAYGLIYHITPESNFWKRFMAIKRGDNVGGICGGPGDGGSHTNPSHRALPESMGKDYEWFASEKKIILDKYNTVYKNKDYNEFIALGTSKLALAGIFHFTRSRKYTPTEEQMCSVLRNVRGGKWPIYAYDQKSLSIERYLKC